MTTHPNVALANQIEEQIVKPLVNANVELVIGSDAMRSHILDIDRAARLVSHLRPTPITFPWHLDTGTSGQSVERELAD